MKKQEKKKSRVNEKSLPFKTSNQLTEGNFDRHPVKLRPSVSVIIAMSLL
jgi:hypothetical protein